MEIVPTLWDASYMPEEAISPLQRFVAKLLVKLPHARDWYDKRYQERTASTGKPLYDIERGKSKNPSRSVLRELADITGEPIGLFMRAADGEDVDPVGAAVEASPAAEREPDVPPTRSIDAGETAEITRLNLALPMGPGATVDDYVEEEPVLFDLAYVRAFTATPPHRLRLASGAGDSMFPTLVPNDLVWIDTTQNQLLHSDRIYACAINGGAAIKRLRPIEGGRRVMIISDNKTIDPYPVDADEVVIWGRVIRFARDL